MTSTHTRTHTLSTYVLVFAVPDFYQEIGRHILLVKKPANSEHHPNLWNLPGGGVPPDLSPEELADPFAIALAKLKEETGYVGTFPKLIGQLQGDASRSPGEKHVFEVLVYTCLVQQDKNNLSSNFPGKPGYNPNLHAYNWFCFTDLLHTNGQFFHNMIGEKIILVPDLLVILPFCITGLKGWTLRENLSYQPTPDSIPSQLYTGNLQLVPYTEPQHDDSKPNVRFQS